LWSSCAGYTGHTEELAIPVVLSGGVGLGVVLISAADGFNVDVAGYLFGSILAVGEGELGWIVVVAALVLAVIFPVPQGAFCPVLR